MSGGGYPNETGGTSGSVDEFLTGDSRLRDSLNEDGGDVSSAAIPVFDLGQMCGEAHVDCPEQQSDKTGFKKFTTFNVHGELSGGKLFCSRKRYSDFDWLRTALCKQFPGVFLPALPGKQKVGRFDDAFIEERRSGLELFLRRLLVRQEICIKHPLVWNFLSATQADLDRVKSEFDLKMLSQLDEDYQVAFSETIQNHNPPKSDKGFIAVKDFLQKHMPLLRTALAVSVTLKKEQASVVLRMTELGKALNSLAQDEANFLDSAGASKNDLRNRILLGLHQHIDEEEGGKQSTTGKASTILCASLQREVEDCESALEALQSIENLQKQEMVANSRIQESSISLAKLQGGPIPPQLDESPSSNDAADSLAVGMRKRDKTSMFFGKMASAVQDMGAKAGINKGREKHLIESIERDKQEVEVLKGHISAARTVFSATEITAFLETKVQGCTWVEDQYATHKAAVAQNLGSLWSTV